MSENRFKIHKDHEFNQMYLAVFSPSIGTQTYNITKTEAEGLIEQIKEVKE